MRVIVFANNLVCSTTLSRLEHSFDVAGNLVLLTMINNLKLQHSPSNLAVVLASSHDPASELFSVLGQVLVLGTVFAYCK